MFITLLNRLTVRSKLILLVAVPTVATLIAAYQDFSSGIAQREQLSELRELTEASIAGGNLVHELQKERGMSAGFLSSGGTKFVDNLPEQRLLTDERLAVFREEAARVIDGGMDSKYVAGLERSLELLDALAQRRDAVSAQEIATGEAVSYYTSINSELLANIFKLSQVSSSAEIARMAVAYANFSSSKERAGIERALFSVTFNLDRFTPANERRILQLINEQDLFLSLFQRSATASQLEAYSVVRQHPDYVQTQSYRDRAFDLREAFGVDSESWFTTITGKINQLRDLEGTLATDLRDAAAREVSSATATLSGLALAGLFFVTVTLVVATGIIVRMQHMLGAEPNVLQGFAARIARGDLTQRGRDNEHDTGLLKSMREMQTMLRQRNEDEQEQAQAIARLTRSLDKISANVIVADADNAVIYANESVSTYLKAFTGDFASQISSFDASQLIGMSLQDFAAEAGTLSESRTEVSVEKTFGNRITQLTFNLVSDDNGAKVGMTLEIEDITDERQVVEEVSSVIARAASGELTHRVVTSGREGVLLTLSESINNMLQVTEEVVADVAGSLEALAKGDLTHRSERQYDGAFANLMHNASQTVDNLTSVVSRIKQSTESVETASEAISDGTRDLSDRTERAAGAIMDTSSRVRDLSDTVQSNADRAAEATTLVYAAREDASSGGAVVDEAIEAMQNINASSNKIAEIIGVIDEIAFQTNLLALNASVEAARAGDQGRGFAVVASEVRNLASRCAKAAQEVKEIIERSIKEVSQGSELVNRTGEKLHEIVSGVQNVSSIVDEIAEASQLQAMSVTSIRSTVEELDDNTQQNAALVEETSSATESTMSQLRSLNELMRFFTTAAGSAANSDWSDHEKKRA